MSKRNRAFTLIELLVVM
ncbi:MAG: prepilin-type N-terminal cleavage/methylation domain-containing protein, partial [Chthoniobacterales bacterium]